jgi:tetratricopeptide (TPR) repeat protein
VAAPGANQLRQSPARAADAFYWATRLEPALPEPWLGLSAALSLAQPTRALGDYLLGATYVAKDRQFQHIDSLRYQALIRNPLMYLPLDAVLLEEWFSRVTQGELTIQELSSEFGPEMAAWWAYSRGRFNDAIRQYSIAVKRHPKWYRLRADRARAYLPLMQYDSAVAAYNELLGLQQQAEEERRNLAFYPAHLALARLDLAIGDSTAAQAEFDQTIQIDSRDAVAHYEYGVLLFTLKRYEAATEQFQQAVDDEPYLAKPYFPLAYLRESEGKNSVAPAMAAR